MFLIGRWVLLSALSATGGQANPPATAAPSALEEGRRLYSMKDYQRAIVRLEEAVRLEPSNAEAYYFLGASLDALAGPRWTATLPSPVPLPPPPPPPPGAQPRAPAAPAPSSSAAPADPQTTELRRKAVDAYAHCLFLDAGDTEPLRRLRKLSFRARLEIGFTEEPPYKMNLSHAREFAQDETLEAVDLILLARTFERLDRPDLAEASYKRLVDMSPGDAAACQALAGLYLRPIWRGRSRFDEAVDTMELCTRGAPDAAAQEYRIAVFLWDKAFRDTKLEPAARLGYAERGLTHVDRVLASHPEDRDALVYKGLLLRVKAGAATEPAQRQQLLQQAKELQLQAAAPRRAEPPAAGGPPVRVGGPIKEPKRLRYVPAAYPDAARQAGVKGVVIVECTIGADGRVTDARVLRGLPLLDDAAVNAVKQWVYAPTLVDGVAVPVLLTVTVSFAP
jgi:TonB family protein